ncbi:MAG: hypothetical protein ACR2M4_00530 [Actinomycetota bacterium]
MTDSDLKQKMLEAAGSSYRKSGIDGQWATAVKTVEAIYPIVAEEIAELKAGRINAEAELDQLKKLANWRQRLGSASLARFLFRAEQAEAERDALKGAYEGLSQYRTAQKAGFRAKIAAEEAQGRSPSTGNDDIKPGPVAADVEALYGYWPRKFAELVVERDRLREESATLLNMSISSVLRLRVEIIETSPRVRKLEAERDRLREALAKICDSPATVALHRIAREALEVGVESAGRPPKPGPGVAEVEAVHGYWPKKFAELEASYWRTKASGYTQRAPTEQTQTGEDA